MFVMVHYVHNNTLYHTLEPHAVWELATTALCQRIGSPNLCLNLGEGKIGLRGGSIMSMSLLQAPLRPWKCLVSIQRCQNVGVCQCYAIVSAKVCSAQEPA